MEILVDGVDVEISGFLIAIAGHKTTTQATGH